MSTFNTVHSENYYLRGELLNFDNLTTDVTNNAGVPGARGLTGDAGVAGDQGLRGLQGEPGIRGLQGIPGSVGLIGPAGPTTIVDTDGTEAIVTGPEGIQGADGIQGVQGDRGVIGLTGNTGSAGIPGVRGDVGLTGIQGIPGVRGQDGIQGPIGLPGPTTVVDTDGTETIVTGPPGTNGADGRVEFLVTRVLDGMNTIVLPNPADVTETGLYYYKDYVFEVSDPVFKLQNGLIVGKFYRSRMQNITFLKANDKWVN